MDAAHLPGTGMVMSGPATAESLRALLDDVVDPEIPVLTIADLGILRSVALGEDGRVVVTITPTYSGCPALDLIRRQIESILEGAGCDRYEVRTVFAPAWTTDWMTAAAKEKLAAYGIAPPGPASLPERGAVLCPRCAGAATRTISEYGSTACKALMVCERCGEPFDYFKEI